MPRRSAAPKKPSVNVLRQGNVHTSGIALGGIGSGGVEIWPDGRLHQWMFPNARPWSNNGHVNKAGPADAPEPQATDADFLVRVAQKGKRPVYRWLFGGHGFTVTTASHFWRHHKYFFIKAFPEIEYRAEFPFAHLSFIDPEFPVQIRMKAWSGFVPHEVKDSSLPGCFFDIEVVNRTKAPVEVSILWQLQNVAGFACAKNAQEHVLTEDGDLTAVTMKGGLDEPGHFSAGEMTMWTSRHAGQTVDAIACNPYFQNLIWSLHRAGHLHAPLIPERLLREEPVREPRAGSPNKGYICARERLGAGKASSTAFGLSWYFPHHIVGKHGDVGHRYQEWFGSALDVARYQATNRVRIEAASAALPDAVMASGMPEELKLALLDQSSTLIKNSHFIRDGRIGIQEGHGCCGFNTVDVDHYGSYALSLLQPELRRTINDMNRQMAHPANGKMYHGHGDSVFARPAGGDAGHGYSRWDVCCQYALQVWRDSAWSGDAEAVRRHFPDVLRAVKLVASMDFYGVGLPFIQGGITYDHWNMQGVVGYMAGVYLASVRAVEEMARLVGDTDAAAWAHQAFERGRAGFEKNLWNGKQYLLFYGRRPLGWKPGDDGVGEHKLLDAVKPPDSCCAGFGCERPKTCIEIGDTGVMTDLLNGDATAAVMGLDSFLDPKRVRKYLQLVLDRNIQEENSCLVNGSYPDEHFLDEWPFMQWQTPWTGTEYFFALMCYANGMTAEGDKVIRLVHERHVRDGMRFDHGECNNHYARPLCIWGAWAARAGLRLNALDGRLGIATPDGKPYQGVLLTGTMVGSCAYVPGRSLEITAIRGRQELRTIEIGGAKKAGKVAVNLGKRRLEADVAVIDGIATIVLAQPVAVEPGAALSVVLGR